MAQVTEEIKRMFRECNFCGEKFVTEQNLMTGDEHICEGIEEEKARRLARLDNDIQQWIKRGLWEGFDQNAERAARVRQEKITIIKANCSGKTLKFKKQAKPTKCGPKCWAAKREDCACECEGHNHGIGRAPQGAK